MGTQITTTTTTTTTTTMFGITLSSRAKTAKMNARVAPRVASGAVQCRAAAGEPLSSSSGGDSGKKLWSPRNEKVVIPQLKNAQPSESFARKMYASECEAAVNRQINIEYSISYLYHAMYAFFDRDNVGLPGFAEYFKHESEEERGHAEKLLEYQNKRGGKVVLGALLSPITEFDHETKGEALYAME